ncbi:sortase [Bhargavaea cecembensis]|uniref:Sortase n=1 Tax=Bhargavaea cecembensis TaxID=394098 RepID=A0A165H6F4_9BACL|nr:class C sortase [Bhargavaea cecembensis]KZE38915.1 sortase [Bhargavaea cecembensis]
MKKKIVLAVIFLIGLGVFAYPIVSNLFSTQVHQSVVSEYDKTVKGMTAEELQLEKEKADRHNEELAGMDHEFVDPFLETAGSGEDEESRSYYDALNIGPAIGSLEIPKIGADLPIYHGTSEEVLSQGVGHLEQSSLPTGKPGTHSVLTAHRGLPTAKMFRHLNRMEIGDKFYVKVLDETMAYEVQHIEAVLPDETGWLQMKEGEELVTLLTCDPYMINTHRLLVTGKRVPFEPEDEEQIAALEEELQWHVYALAALALLIVGYIFYLIRKKVAKREEV